MGSYMRATSPTSTSAAKEQPECLHRGAPGLVRAIGELWPGADRQRCAVHRLRNILAKLPKNQALHDRIRAAYWSALDEADSPEQAEAGLRTLVGELERDYPSAAACLADDLPALSVHRATRSICARAGVPATCWSGRWARSSGAPR